MCVMHFPPMLAPGARVALVAPSGPLSDEQDLARVLAEPWKQISVTEPSMTPLRRGTARGRLAGGNLALLAALAGTPYAPDLDGAILVLEDVNEAVYRIDRMLTQLWLSGALRSVAGLAFGAFTEIPDDPANAERPLTRVLEEFAARCGVPCVSGFPMGHVDDQDTFPLGAMASLNADEGVLVVDR
jgi:muramoyltetrapeptide carboxypeptidase